MSFIVYILYSESKDKYYIGSCADISICLTQYNTGRNTSTKSGIPWRLVYTDEVNTLQEEQAETAKGLFEMKNKVAGFDPKLTGVKI